ncbi:hypothetical protein [Vibrio parahaemolyticus]|uniref:hypothetical protein n=1 Tax=Vibrio parahaemolyticus TaxID=670 RepID=UPI0035C0A037|nr:hypothetical protein [Vibrio parahaemolyticus]
MNNKIDKEYIDDKPSVTDSKPSRYPYIFIPLALLCVALYSIDLIEVWLTHQGVGMNVYSSIDNIVIILFSLTVYRDYKKDIIGHKQKRLLLIASSLAILILIIKVYTKFFL